MLTIEIAIAYIALTLALLKVFRGILFKLALLKKSLDIQKAKIIVLSSRIEYIETQLSEKLSGYKVHMEINFDELEDDNTGF